MDRDLQNILTKLSQNVHGSHGRNNFTWHQNVTGKGLSKNTKCLKSATL